MKNREMLMELWKKRKNLDDVTIKMKFEAFLRMVPLILKKEYKPLKKRNLILAIAALIYAVSPLDFIPDVVFGPFSLLDDMVILGLAARVLDKEVEHFLLWEQNQSDILFN